MYINATKKEIDESLSAGGATVLFFSLPTCSRCKYMLSMLDEAIKKDGGLDGVRILKIDCSSDIDIAKEYGIETVPTVVVCHGGDSEKHSGKVDIKKIVESIGVFLKK